MASFFFTILKVFFFLTFPFILLIRGSIFFHANYSWPPWPSMIGGGVIAAVVIMLYLSYLQYKLVQDSESGTSLKSRFLIAAILVLGYSIHGLLFLSESNAKTKEVKKEFTSLHPILRLGTSTILFLDKNLIITDANRAPEDYRKMGLKSKTRSLHYRQKNGYVHAMDIRTNGRSEVRNFLLKAYFWSMGFNVLRHGGTGDHLHISLHSHDSPGAV